MDTEEQVRNGTIEHTLAYVFARMGGNPIGQTFTFHLEHDGLVYTHSGLVPLVDGDRVTFHLDEHTTLKAVRTVEEAMAASRTE